MEARTPLAESAFSVLPNLRGFLFEQDGDLDPCLNPSFLSQQVEYHFPCCVSRGLVFGLFACGCHLHKYRIELPNDFHKISLCSHHLVDILVPG